MATDIAVDLFLNVVLLSDRWIISYWFLNRVTWIMWHDYKNLTTQRLHRCWYRMLVTVYVRDNFVMLVTDYLPFKSHHHYNSATIIMILPPTSWNCHQYNIVTNIKIAPMKLSKAEELEWTRNKIRDSGTLVTHLESVKGRFSYWNIYCCDTSKKRYNPCGKKVNIEKR